MTTTIASDIQAAPREVEPTFDVLPLSDGTRRAIDEMGWVNPTPVQIATYERAAAGRDLIVQARTGTGKTGAFGIPLVDRSVEHGKGVQALVLAPTRELALQSARELAKLGHHKGIRTSAVYGGAPMEKQVRELAAGAEIVSGTPGRVLDHLKRRTLDCSGLRVLVLDEADEMLSMGFAEELNAIVERLPKQRQTLLFSATVDRDVERVAQRHMHEAEHVLLSSDQVGATTISHYAYFVSGRGRGGDLVRILEVLDPESAIIFCNTKAETEMVAMQLQQSGFDADWLNGDLPQSDREKVMARLRRGELRFLVATDVAARGIDVSHVTHVINYTFPEAIEQYIHRTGRTGRAGRTGTAISLVSPQELGSLYYLRLQYKIFPVERSLPTKGEVKARSEIDRIALLDEAFRHEPSDLDRAVARRLLTHPAAERLLGGLLATFFGAEEEVDEQAAAARRARRPEPVVLEQEKPSQKRAPREPRPAPRVAERERDTRDAGATDEAPLGAEAAQGADSDGDEKVEGMTRLYVSVGRRDGLRAGDIARIFRDVASLKRSDIGRIRVRDKHAFVDVLDEQASAAVAALNGHEIEGRALVVERAMAK